MRHVYEALYELDLHDCTTQLGLAAGEPEPVGELGYTVALRSDALFSDGTPVTASDVANAFELNLANDTYAALLFPITSAQAREDGTVALSLAQPFDAELLKARLSLVKVFPATSSVPVMPDALGVSASAQGSASSQSSSQASSQSISSSSAVSTSRVPATDPGSSESDGDEARIPPIGSGPWVVESIDGRERGAITFAPNAFYAGDTPAGADKMTFSIATDAGQRADMVARGAVQVAESVPLSRVDGLVGDGVSVDTLQTFNQALLFFNCQKKPFNDPRVRRAFFYAIDVEGLIANVLDGGARAVTGFLPAGHPNYHRAATVYTHSPQRARQLLLEAGVRSLSVTLNVNNNWVADLAPLIRSDLEKVGITVKLDENKIVWQDLAPREDGSVNEDFDCALVSGDPSCFGYDPDLLMSWWYGDNDWTRGRTYWAEAEDGQFARLQELLQQARGSSGELQQELWNECFNLIAENVPLYALLHREAATAYRASEIRGFDAIAFPGLDLLGTSL